MIDGKDLPGFGVFRVGARLIGVPIDNLAEVCVVPTVSKIMAPSGPVVGAFDLRGSLVPLLDCEKLFEPSKPSRAVSTAVVLQHAGRILAIALDDIVRLAEVQPIDTQLGASEQTSKQSIADHFVQRAFPSGFVMSGDVVSCLDANALFSRHDVMSVAHTRAGARRVDTGHNGKYLIFRAGGAHFGLDTEHISATVPKNQLKTAGVRVDRGLCLGFTDHFGWRVPVIDTNRALGVGTVNAPGETETVLLRFPEGKLLGLHVDRTVGLKSLPPEKQSESSALISKTGLLKKVHVTENETQVFVIDFDALSCREDLRALSKLSSQTPGADDLVATAATAESGSIQENTRYLIFESGRRLAAPADKISRILRMPSTIVPSQETPQGVLGFFSVGNRSVPLVTLSEPSTKGDSEGYVLLVTVEGGQVGFVADSICAIETSEWRIPNRTGAPEQTDLIKIKGSDQRNLIAVSDLCGMAQELIGDGLVEKVLYNE